MFYSWIQVSNNRKIYIFAKKKISLEKEIQLMFATNFKIAIRDTSWGRFFEARLATVDKSQINNTLIHLVNEWD